MDSGTDGQNQHCSLTCTSQVCYNFHRFRHEAGCADKARVLHPDGAFYPPLRLRSGAALKPTGGLCVLPSYFCCYRHHEGVCRWLVSRADPFFVWPKEEAFYENEPHSTTRSLVLAALFLALAFVLPMITGHVPQVGNMLCPMHFPILLCGFVLGGPWGLAVGFIAPLVRSVLFGMPPMFPIAIAMAFELAAYGLVSGVLWHKVKHTVPMMYASLVTAMVAGRLVWGCRPLCAGRPDRFQLSVQRVFVRCAAHRCAGHRGSAGAHPADFGGFAEGKGHRLSSRYAKRGCCQTPSDIAYAMPPPSMREASQLTVMSGSLREGAGAAKP